MASIEELRERLRASKEEMARLGITESRAEKIIRTILTAAQSNPKLLACEYRSLMAAVFHAVHADVEVGGPFSEAEILPYKAKGPDGRKIYLARFEMTYRGIINSALRGGVVKKIISRVARENDEFYYTYGTNERIEHEPAIADRGDWTHVYAIAWMGKDFFQFDVMDRDEVYHVREKSRGYQAAKRYGKDSPWLTDETEMARKTVVKRLGKYIPLKREIATIIQLDDTVFDVSDIPETESEEIEKEMAARPVTPEPAEKRPAQAQENEQYMLPDDMPEPFRPENFGEQVEDFAREKVEARKPAPKIPIGRKIEF